MIIQEIKAEEVKVHVDLDRRIKVATFCRLLAQDLCSCDQAITLSDLPTMCFPPQAATDKLASLRAKALKYVIRSHIVVFLDYTPLWQE